MKRWKVIFAAVLIFLSGAVSGAFAWKAANVQGRGSHVRSMPPSMLDARFDALKHMQRELSLSPAQTSRVDAILEGGRKRMKQIWETSCQPQVREEMKRVHGLISAELDAEQRSKYDELLKRAKSRHLEHKDGEPPAHKPIP